MVGPAECGRCWGGFGRGQEQENQGKRLGQEQKARNSENDEIMANLRLIQHAAARRGGGSLRAFRRAGLRIQQTRTATDQQSNKPTNQQSNNPTQQSTNPPTQQPTNPPTLQCSNPWFRLGPAPARDLNVLPRLC